MDLKYGLLGCSLLGLTFCAAAPTYAQYPGQYPDSHYREFREPLDRVRGDLDRAAGDMYYLTGSERHRFDKAREQIAEFQYKWERGHLDRGELDRVIGDLQHVVDKNRLEERDRRVLVDDLYKLRDFRARTSRW
jgi:hypothetical protein